MANNSWDITANDNLNTEQKDNTKDISYKYVQQMSAVYNTNAYEKDTILELYFTDLNKRYQLFMQKNCCEVITDNIKKPTTKIEIKFELWQDISAGKIDGQQALFEGQYKVIGDLKTMVKMNEFFGISKHHQVKKTFPLIPS